MPLRLAVATTVPLIAGIRKGLRHYRPDAEKRAKPRARNSVAEVDPCRPRGFDYVVIPLDSLLFAQDFLDRDCHDVR